MNRLMNALVLLILFAAPVFSQSSPPGAPPPTEQRVNADRIRQQDISRREWQLRNFGNEPVTPKDERQVKALMAQTEEDKRSALQHDPRYQSPDRPQLRSRARANLTR